MILTEDEVRSLLRECVTVVKPGETLVILADRDWTPSQVRELQDALDAGIKYRDLGIHALVVPGAELGVAEPPGVTHACPPEGTGGLMPCCGLTPYEVSRTDRMTLDPSLVTCGKAAADA